MKSDAEKKFRALMKEVVESESYKNEMKERFAKAGYEKPPDIATLLARAKKRKRKLDFTKYCYLPKKLHAIKRVLKHGGLTYTWNKSD